MVWLWQMFLHPLGLNRLNLIIWVVLMSRKARQELLEMVRL